MEKTETEKKFPYFTIGFYTVLSILSVYLFLCQPIGISVYWGVLAFLSVWHVKESVDGDVPAIMIVWESLQFMLFFALAMAFAVTNHALAIAGLSTLLFQGIIGTIYECHRSPDEESAIIFGSLPVVAAYLIMTVCLINRIPF